MPKKVAPAKKSAPHTEEGPKKSVTGKGWGAVQRVKKNSEERRKALDNKPRDFYLTEDIDTALIQFLDVEPYCTEGYNIKCRKDGYWRYFPDQKMVQKHTLIDTATHKKTWRASFKVADYRGNWDKDEKEFKNDERIVKIWTVGNAIALQIRAAAEDTERGLLGYVWKVTRTGSGKSTTYSVAVARKKGSDTPLPIDRDIEDKYPPTEECVVPPTDDELIYLGAAKTDSSHDDEDEDLDI